jgi:hypothetical protein
VLTSDVRVIGHPPLAKSFNWDRTCSAVTLDSRTRNFSEIRWFAVEAVLTDWHLVLAPRYLTVFVDVEIRWVVARIFRVIQLLVQAFPVCTPVRDSTFASGLLL